MKSIFILGLGLAATVLALYIPPPGNGAGHLRSPTSYTPRELHAIGSARHLQKRELIPATPEEREMIQIIGFSPCIEDREISYVLSDDRDAISFFRDGPFNVTTGPGIDPKLRRKRCQDNIRFRAPKGLLFEVVGVSYDGERLELEAGCNARQQFSFFFKGQFGSRQTGWERKGPTTESISLSHDFPLTNPLCSREEHSLSIERISELIPMVADCKGYLGYAAFGLPPGSRLVLRMNWYRCVEA
ncbi:hypothetical protein FQN57_000698 [Myotisia sp. PD_48]|nr:hypothetical protein FQN57_000698 [Myotisia sp. PD_48]